MRKIPHYLIDANCINARQKNEDINKLEDLRNKGKISLSLPEIAYDEAGFRSTLRQKKLEGYLFEGVVDQERRFEYKYTQIENILFPNGAKKQNQKNDVKILVYSAITGIPFISMDGASKSQPGGMLGNKVLLKKFGVKILSPSEALAEIASTWRKSEMYSARVGRISLRNLPHENDAKP